MKKIIYGVAVLVAALFASCNSNEETVWTLDLSKATTDLQFDENGLWTGTYDTKAAAIESQCFAFNHMGAVYTYEYDGVSYDSPYYMGFTASNEKTADATKAESACTKGGLQGEGTPYLVCYWGDYVDYTTGEMVRFSDVLFDKSADTFTPKAIYVCNTVKVIKSLQEGDSYARAFKAGDYLALTIMPLNEQKEVIQGVEVKYYLADFRDGKEFINQAWEKIDLSALGACAGITFSMETTDMGEYGANTPLYFCVDGLSVAAAWAK